ncbi:MAG: YciI family protein [Pseudomonadota bacterium]
MADYAPTAQRLKEKVFAVFCTDGPNAAKLREEHLEGHLLHTEKHWDKYIVAGPLRPVDDVELNGSLFLIMAENEEEAWEILNGDPYFQTDIYATKDLRVFTPAIGQFLGGVIWDSAAALKDATVNGRRADAKV